MIQILQCLSDVRNRYRKRELAVAVIAGQPIRW